MRYFHMSRFSRQTQKIWNGLAMFYNIKSIDISFFQEQNPAGGVGKKPSLGLKVSTT